MDHVMNFTEIMTMLENATPYELYRLRAALKIEMENLEKINVLRDYFVVKDQISYFNEKKNALCKAIVLEKNIKYVVIQDIDDKTIWNAPYYSINITNQDSKIYAKKSENLTCNHLSLGELVGFMHNGHQIVGKIKKLNSKTVNLLTSDGNRWNVGYEWLFKIFDGEHAEEINGGLFIEGTVDVIK